MQTLADLLNTIPAIDPAAMSRAQRHIDGLLKPVGSFGKAGGACHTTGRNAGVEWHTACGQKAVLVMCADHGVWEEGVAISQRSDSHSG